MAAIQQVTTKTCTLRSVMRTAAFIKGHKEALQGKPFNYDAYPNTNDQWFYERGRLFGMIYKYPVKDGKTITYDALYAFANAWNANLIM